LPGRSEPSQRQLRVGEQIRHLLAEDLAHGAIHDPRLDGVSITVGEVRASPDLRHAVVFVAELGRELAATTLAALEAAAPGLAGRLARRMHLKYAPRLRFVADPSFAEADRVQRLIAEDLRRLDVTRDDGVRRGEGPGDG
jgi:ribosome-binding factor A